MRIISRKKLREFWEQHPDARPSLESWFVDVKQADWGSPVDIKVVYRKASIIAQNRVVFNIKGNKYRLIVFVQYAFRIVYIRFIGTHQEYQRIDAKAI
jgi:mRNA interferase HigB